MDNILVICMIISNYLREPKIKCYQFFLLSTIDYYIYEFSCQFGRFFYFFSLSLLQCVVGLPCFEYNADTMLPYIVCRAGEGGKVGMILRARVR